MSASSVLDIQTHLERVSRSFAFCIARLDEPLREQVGLAYLLCRILDTVEDSRWSDAALQSESFAGFIAILRDATKAKAWSDSLLLNTTGISSGEVLLVRDSELVIRRLHSLPKGPREIIEPPVISMAQGMREFSRTRSLNHDRLTLKTLQDVNRYCFFVAGVVGEVLDGLLRTEANAAGCVVKTKLSDGFRFGLFLQKVNVLKDRETDFNEGRDLVPMVGDVFDSAFDDASYAFRYLQAIPDEFRSYRLFCAWSLFLGLASLPHIARGGKIGRVETVALLAKVDRKLDAPEKLASLFASMLTGAIDAAPRRGEESQKFFASENLSKEVEKSRVALYRTWYVGAARDEDLAAIV